MHLHQSGTGPDTILFVHGYPFHGGMWAPQLEALPEGWRGLAPDLPGFGRSPRGGSDLSMEAQADALAALLDEHGVGRAVVCGLSMGGYVAFALWRRHRERVRALVLADTRAGADTAEAVAHRRSLATRFREQGPESAVEALLPGLTGPETQEHRPEVVARIREMIAATPVETLAAAQEAMARRPDSTPLLATIDVPTLVVVGEHDAIRPDAQAMALAIPGARFEVISEAGHVSNLENATAFNRAVAGVLVTTRG